MPDLTPLKWRAKRNRDGQQIPNCWITDSGYTVSECRLPEKRFTVTRPGDAAPFAYLGSRDEVVSVIRADMKASGVLA
ncbi:hypothetical protein [Pseudomonas citronellolis]|uniref:hypothetical protein n=1 Tax=Pseudomonas citronellolis TaxID=53408 RepID=UPI00078E5113|nr:hypothetical protein [Pseudomonas citronellolis]AMO77511.1 hypothetical protein PcP3B5_41070 [Pseudomonas citronellolis]